MKTKIDICLAVKTVTRKFTAVAALLVIAAAAPSAYAQSNIAVWGDNRAGVVSHAPSGAFTAVAAGGDWQVGGHCVAIRPDGTLVSWGNNSDGQVSGTPAGTFSAVAASEAMAASPWLALSADTSVSKRRIWMVQVSLSSSHIMRARSTLKPCGLPSGPAKLNGG